MSAGYEDEQKKLRATVAELTAYIDTAEQKSADVTAFIKAVLTFTSTMKKIHNNCKKTKSPRICYQMWGLRTFCEIVLAKTSIAYPGVRRRGQSCFCNPPELF